MVRLALLLMILVLDAAEPVNLLVNGSFEGATLAPWTAGNGGNGSGGQAPSQVAGAATAASGTKICQATGDVEQTFTATVGQTYKATVWLRITGETEGTWGGLFVYLTGAQDWWQDINTIGVSEAFHRARQGSGWFKTALTFTATHATMHLHCHYRGNGSMTYQIDDAKVFLKPTTNQPPAFTVALTPEPVGVGQVQTFAVTGDDADGAIANVVWDFGDGNGGLGASGSRTVPRAGTFTGRVTVVDDDDAAVSSTLVWTASGPAPALTILQPADGAVVSTPTVQVTGTSTATTIRVSSDRDELVVAAGTATWSATVSLKPGRNRLLVQARDAAGRWATGERSVRFVPSDPLAIVDVTAPATVPRWEPAEITFGVQGSAATHPHLPYATGLAAGVDWVDGMTMEAEFSDDGWTTVLRRPGFMYQPYQRLSKNGQEWMHPQGARVGCVRFAPPRQGTWAYRLAIHERRGDAYHAGGTFVVTAPPAGSHGPLRPGGADPRYFVHADGTPFVGACVTTGFDAKNLSFDAQARFTGDFAGNEDFFRWWIAGKLWGTAWWAWDGFTGNYVTVRKADVSGIVRYGDSLASMRLDGDPDFIDPNDGQHSQNWIRFQGWESSGNTAVKRNTQYRIRVRWRAENVTGPLDAAKPAWGGSVRLLVDGNGQGVWPSAATIANAQLAVGMLQGDTPWHVAEGTVTIGGNVDYANPALVCENTTGGHVYVDEVSMREVLADGSLGSNLVRNARADALSEFQQAVGASYDAVFAAAQAANKHFRLVLSEKQEWLLDHIGAGGLPSAKDGSFFHTTGSVAQWHDWYWRHLIARFGAFRSIHSWEVANECGSAGPPFITADRLAQMATTDGNPHPGSISTPATSGTEIAGTWTNPLYPHLDHADFHCYVRYTGWLDGSIPEEDLFRDTARYMAAYDASARAAFTGALARPIIWGEQGLDSLVNIMTEDPLVRTDTAGIWLKKIQWARCGAGGTYPFYWWTGSIDANHLHPIYGAWKRFMAGIPLANGRYVDAAPACTGGLRAWGQKDVLDGCAHVWVDNPEHTWHRVVVQGLTPGTKTGTIAIALGHPGASFRLTEWNTDTGTAGPNFQATADGAGVVSWSVINLTTDRAYQVELLGGGRTPAAPHLDSAIAIGDRVVLRWTDNSPDESGFEIQGARDGGAWTSLGTVGADMDTTTCPGLAAGTWTFRVRAAAAAASGWSNVLSAVVTSQPAAPVITSPASVQGRVGLLFQYQITASHAPTSFGAIGLPSGLTLDPATGLISGIPVGVGNWSVVLSATNASGTGSAPLALAVASMGTIVITSSPPLVATAGTPWSYTPTIRSTTVSPPVWTIVAGSTPGCGIDAGTGVVSWPNPGPAGSHADIRIRASVGDASEEQRILVLVIAPNAPG